MDAMTLIADVRTLAENDWEDSDLWFEAESMLVDIAEHYRDCAECREAFDAQGYPEGTLIEFANNHLGTTTIDDWICESPAIDLSALDYVDPLALLEVDSGGDARRILLVIDWETQKIYAETRDSKAGLISGYRRHGRESAYTIHPLADAGRLRGWVENVILPRARPLFAAYERQWDGDRWIGAFPGAEGAFGGFTAWMATEAEPPLLQGGCAGIWSVEEWLVDIPEGLTPGTSNYELQKMENELVEEAKSEQVVLRGSVRRHLAIMREALGAAEKALRKRGGGPNKYVIEGYEVLEAKPKPFGEKSAHISLPGKYLGKRLKIVLTEPLDEGDRT